ncbi:TolB family protein [Angustibacter sp. McL0619]|uniref:TolB family protein n=1 Tax=Angustibacter sp. McL0619 TaxID=3415676 RepID=UPI003CEBF635
MNDHRTPTSHGRTMRRRRVGQALGLVSALVVGLAAAPAASAAERDPGATRLVWNSYDLAAPMSRLVVGDIRTGSSRVLTRPDAGSFDTEPVRSPDGRSVLFNRESDAGVQIVLARVDRPRATQVIDTGCAAIPDCVADVNPTWAPDGRHVLVTRVLGPVDPVTGDATSAVLMIVRLDGSGARRFSEPGTHGTTEDNVARFAPDGRHVVFVRDQPVDGVLHFALFRMLVDGTAVQQLTSWELDADRPSVSPARHGPTAGLVSFETFGGGHPGRGDIALLPLDCRSLAACTRTTRLVTHNAGSPRSSFAATWSPDGRQLAYAQEPDTSGQVDIWTSRWDGSHARRVTSSGHEFSPAWSF